MSNLVDHARTELELIGEDPETVKGILGVIQAFADMGHSGGSASVCIPRINRLLQYQEISSLTDNPDEWEWRNEEMFPPAGIWQSKRNPKAFSTNGGLSYYLIDDEESAINPIISKTYIRGEES